MIRQSPDGPVLAKFDIKPGWQQWILLSADRHWDHPKSDHAMQKRHLDEALQRNALIIDIGDLFCAMQGRNDKRGSKKDIRPEHQTDRYLSSLIETATEFFAPYAKNWLLIGTGNHESSVLQKHEVDLTGDLVRNLNQATNSSICRGDFAGWVVFQFLNGKHGPPSKKLFYHHGYGGGGPVTRGTIQTNRRAVYLPDADIIVTGHIHERWVMEVTRERINQQGRTYMDEQMHVNLPTYKDEYSGHKNGWHHERGGPPKPIGAVWMLLSYTSRQKGIMVDFSRAT